MWNITFRQLLKIRSAFLQKFSYQNSGSYISWLELLINYLIWCVRFTEVAAVTCFLLGSIFIIFNEKFLGKTWPALGKVQSWAKYLGKSEKPRKIGLQKTFFFYLGFLSRTFTNHGTAREWGRQFFNSSLPLPPTSQTH